MAQESHLKPSVEIVMVSYGRMEILSETLAHIRRLYPDTLLCLGIQGEKPSKEFINHFVINQPTRLLHFDEPSVTRTLNACIGSSEADICLILDDDAWPCPGWLEGHLEAFAEAPGLAGLAYTVGREIRVRKCRSFGKEIFWYLVESLHRFSTPTEARLCGRLVGWATKTGFVFGNFDLPGQALVNSARGCNMAVLRQLFMSLRGFNEEFRGNSWGFETEFGLRAQQKGKLGKYIGQAAVLHSEAETGGTRSLGREAYARDFMHNQKLLKRQLGPWAVFGNCARIWRLRRRIRKLSE